MSQEAWRHLLLLLEPIAALRIHITTTLSNAGWPVGQKTLEITQWQNW